VSLHTSLPLRLGQPLQLQLDERLVPKFIAGSIGNSGITPQSSLAVCVSQYCGRLYRCGNSGIPILLPAARCPGSRAVVHMHRVKLSNCAPYNHKRTPNYGHRTPIETYFGASRSDVQPVEVHEVSKQDSSRLDEQSCTGSLARVVWQARAKSRDLAQVAGVANPIAASVQMLQE
jgi:hypothetical protein